VGADGTLDLLRADKPYGELKKFACFNSVSSVEEVDGPPLDDVPPVVAPDAIEAAPANANADADGDTDIPW
jgi:hypothetical protein